MKKVLLMSLVVASIAAFSAAQADVLWSQPSNNTNGIASQDFPDFPTFSIYGFDDFTVGGPGWFVDTVSVPGFSFSGGNPALNLDVILRIQDNASFTAPGTIYAEIHQNQFTANLTFNLASVQLNPGTYHISAWVRRNFGGGGGQWAWYVGTTNNGAGAVQHNPGNGFGAGTNPFPVLVGGNPADLAFTIEGSEVPEPASMIALGAGLVGLIARRRRNA
jgi:hypothetical protein